jgi:penicillin amidase
MKLIKSVVSGLFALALVIVLNTKFGDIPPLAKFLDPFQGFWTNAEGKKQNPEKEFIIEGLKGEVQIRFDDQMIPHILKNFISLRVIWDTRFSKPSSQP